MAINRINKLIVASILLLMVPDIAKFVKQLIPVSDQASSTPISNNISPTQSIQPSPQRSPIPATKAYEYSSNNLKLALTIPPGAYQVMGDKVTDWGDEMKGLNAIERYLVIQEQNTGVRFFLELAASIGDKQFSWEGTPSHFPGKIGQNEDLTKLLDRLQVIGALHVEKTYIDILRTYAYIAYTKRCYGSCGLSRVYLIPFENEINGRFYNTLTVSTDLTDLIWVDDIEMNKRLDELARNNYIKQSFGPDTQKIIDTQDQLVGSIVIDR